VHHEKLSGMMNSSIKLIGNETGYAESALSIAIFE